tara:strand:+ start:368 stop:1321 length:954 start_codon:yes stop_codon:yes gene_type:complete
MKKSDRIYVAGHTGMVGSAIVKRLKYDGYNNLLLASHNELELLDQNAVANFFTREQPNYVFLAAAKVGGIKANDQYRGKFLYENMTIQNNIIHSAFETDVKKLLFFGSACIYPRNAKQPIKEEYLLSDYLESTNEPYAIAKISGLKLCENYFREYGKNFISIMPNNLYGPHDNFDLNTSHVLPALIRKFYEGKINFNRDVEIWGTGSPQREFLHVDDLVDACMFLMKNLDAKKLHEMGISHINVGSGEECTIQELSILIKDIVGFKGNLIFNSDYPDGTPRKLLDISRLRSMGWESSINLEDGIKNLYNWYRENVDN